MSWSDIGEFIKAVAPVFTAGAACTAAWIAWRGLNRWRDETIGKRKAELAEDVIADFYEAREIILEARLPGPIPADQGDTRSKMDDETPEETEQYNVYNLVSQRLSKKSDFLARLQARKYRFIAQFGVEAVKPYNDLSQILGDIRIAVHMLTVTHKMHKTPELETNRRKWLTTIYGGADEDDIRKRLDATVTAIDETCRPAIQETVK